MNDRGTKFSGQGAEPSLGEEGRQQGKAVVLVAGEDLVTTLAVQHHLHVLGGFGHHFPLGIKGRPADGFVLMRLDLRDRTSESLFRGVDEVTPHPDEFGNAPREPAFVNRLPRKGRRECIECSG